MIDHYETVCCPCMSHLSAEYCGWVCGMVMVVVVQGIFSSLVAAPKETHKHHQHIDCFSVPFGIFVHDISPLGQ